MNIEQSIMQASTELHNRIDVEAEIAKQHIHEQAERAMDEIRVQIGWMNRSAGQVRRWRNAKL